MAPTLAYYDKILLSIGVCLLVGLAVGLFTGTPIREGLAGASLFATVFVYMGVFRNPPEAPVQTRGKAAAVVWHVFLLVLLEPYFLG